MPIPGSLYRAIERGRVYALDAAGGLVWPRPVEIEDQHLLLNQPARLPVLTFACQPYRQKVNGSGGYHAAVLCIDKRTGRKVYDDENSNEATSIFEVTGEPAKKTVTLRLQSSTVTLTFTDDPLAGGRGRRREDEDRPDRPAMRGSRRSALGIRGASADGKRSAALAQLE